METYGQQQQHMATSNQYQHQQNQQNHQMRFSYPNTQIHHTQQHPAHFLQPPPRYHSPHHQQDNQSYPASKAPQPLPSSADAQTNQAEAQDSVEPSVKPKLTKAKEGQVEWRSREVFALIDAWILHHHRLKDSSNKEKKKIWDKIVETLEESQGIELNKNASQISKRRKT